MARYNRYKIATWVLVFLVILEGLLIFHLLSRPPRKIIKVFPPVIKGRIAIVIDDWGYNLNNLPLLDKLKYPLTASILPGLAYSRQAADALSRRGWEIILHLPMEPHEKYRLEKNTITTSMDAPTVRRILARDLGFLAQLKGVSNHMGSRATEDSRVMGIVFGELKKRHLYFLDSFVSPKSICSGLAEEMQLGFARRDIFLDNRQEPAYIRRQIDKLKLKATLYGRAIGIGHDHRATLEVLAEAMPQIEKEGYQFVFVSELVR